MPAICRPFPTPVASPMKKPARSPGTPQNIPQMTVVPQQHIWADLSHTVVVLHKSHSTSAGCPTAICRAAFSFPVLMQRSAKQHGSVRSMGASATLAMVQSPCMCCPGAVGASSYRRAGCPHACCMRTGRPPAAAGSACPGSRCGPAGCQTANMMWTAAGWCCTHRALIDDVLPVVPNQDVVGTPACYCTRKLVPRMLVILVPGTAAWLVTDSTVPQGGRLCDFARMWQPALNGPAAHRMM